VEILGVGFCGQCAREQEAYFAIGELTQQEEDEAQGFRRKALERMRRDRTGRPDLSLDADKVVLA
jgi:hypothetical protein